jgi:putative membrane protein
MRRFGRYALVMVLAVAPATAQGQSKLSDVEMAHVAVIASNIDIAYAHLALALSENAAVRNFAETMIRDHTAVNKQVFELAARLKVQAKDNAMSQALVKDSKRIIDEMTRLRGSAFDRYYVDNELRYHRAVNGAVAEEFIPNAANAEVRKAFEGALVIFRGHEKHAEMIVADLEHGGSAASGRRQR